MPSATVSRLPFSFACTSLFVNISLRTTNDSLAAGLDAMFQGSLDKHELPGSSNAAIVSSTVASDATSPSHQAALPDIPSPAFLASVIAAVKQALLALSSTHTSMAGAIGGIPATSALNRQSLKGQATAFAASGMGFPAVPASITRPVASSKGRPNFVVPSFVSTFCAPLVSSVAPWPSSIANGLSSSVPYSLPVPTLPHHPALFADHGITAGVLPHLLSAVLRLSVPDAPASMQSQSVL